MKGCTPEADEEMAAMVPPPPPAGGKMGDGEDPAAEHTKLCLMTKARGGVGVAMGAFVLLAMLFGTKWTHLDASYDKISPASTRFSQHGRGHSSSTAPLIPIPFSCNGTDTSSPTIPSSSSSSKRRYYPGVPPAWCPDYFRHIHTDMEPWRTAGISRDLVERGQPHAEFRLVVVAGRAYVEKYGESFQTRDVFTQWGILQLLARYPGRVPDVDIMFSTIDSPRVFVYDYPSHSDAPPVFRYCKEQKLELSILFPDWSFWGWPEVNVRPWAPLMEDLVRENARLPWPERQPYAFWKGNPDVSDVRKDLFKCNNDSAAGTEWNARLFVQDWGAAAGNGFRDSDLARQCRYRYKIYVQGQSWSVSEKYILACDSPMLAIDTPFRDFFSRGLVAGRHYWPVDPADKCRAVKFAVDWGNAHPALARRMGDEGSGFAKEEMGMEYVYEYMLSVLTQYAALLRYKPTVPEKAVEISLESMACSRSGREREFMMQSREKYVAVDEPCTLPPPLTAEEVREMAAGDEEVRSKLQQMVGH